MKKLILILCAALTLASCSKDIPVNENKGNPISFTSEIGTKATSFVTTDNLAYFYSTARNSSSQLYFDKQLFEKQSSGFFTSSPEYYWPGDGSTLKFYCYASSKPSSELASLAPEFVGGNYQISNYTPSTDISQQEDLIYGYAEGSKTNETAGLGISMSHALSRISLKAKNTNEGYTYVITGVKLACIASKGNFIFPNIAGALGGWTPATDTKNNYIVEYAAAPVTLNDTPQSLMNTGDIIVIPQKPTAWVASSGTDKQNTAQGAYLAVKVEITTKSGADVYKGWAATPIGDEWTQGKIYTYILDFSTGAGYVDPTSTVNPGEKILGGAIKFKLDSVTDWATGFESGIDM